MISNDAGHTTGDSALDATNEIIAEVDRQMKSGGIHLTDLAMKIVGIIEKHKAVKSVPWVHKGRGR